MPMIDAYADSTLFPKESPKALVRSDERRAPRRGRDAPGGLSSAKHCGLSEPERKER
jgi:hypothetical protein